MRQVNKILDRMANERIAGIFPLKNARKHQSIGQPRRHILGRMHGNVDCPGKQRLFNFLGEKPLAANFRQRPVLYPVAAGRNHHDFKCRFGQTDVPWTGAGASHWPDRVPRREPRVPILSGRTAADVCIAKSP